MQLTIKKSVILLLINVENYKTPINGKQKG